MDPENHRTDDHQRELHADKHTEFRVTPVHLEISPAQHRKVQTIVTTGDQQENRHNGIDGSAVEIPDAGVVRREAADGDS
ncbi:hypothetical protein D3C80_1897180 [compost metagenome]